MRFPARPVARKLCCFLGDHSAQLIARCVQQKKKITGNTVISAFQDTHGVACKMNAQAVAK